MKSSTLRQQIKADRNQLSHKRLKQHSQKLLDHMASFKPFRQSKRIAFYHAVNGEIDPKPLLEEALSRGKTPYLPILRRDAAIGLWFAPYQHNSKLQLNRFGIPEPVVAQRQLIKPWALDMVFVPLVAFDNHGHRLGMGGGYYDRTFAFKLHRTYLTGPVMVGLAHNLQHRPSIASNPWDIPLDWVITETHRYRF